MTGKESWKSITTFEYLLMELQAYHEAWKWNTYEVYKHRLDDVDLSPAQREAAVRAIARELQL